MSDESRTEDDVMSQRLLAQVDELYLRPEIERRRAAGTLPEGFEAKRVIDAWMNFYNTGRPHSALAGRTPMEAYRGELPVDMMDKSLRGLPTSPQAQQQQQGDQIKRTLAA